MKDLFGVEIPEPQYQHPLTGRRGRNSKPRGYARRPGSGPAGETCGSCANYCRVQRGAGVYRKCAVIEFRWTRSSTTDIQAKSPACDMWAKPEETAQ